MKEVVNQNNLSQLPKCCQVDHVSSCKLFKLDPTVLGESKVNLSPLYYGDFDLIENIDDNSDAFYYKRNSSGKFFSKFVFMKSPCHFNYINILLSFLFFCRF